jgi:hypothetical protein
VRPTGDGAELFQRRLDLRGSARRVDLGGLGGDGDDDPSRGPFQKIPIIGGELRDQLDLDPSRHLEIFRRGLTGQQGRRQHERDAQDPAGPMPSGRGCASAPTRPLHAWFGPGPSRTRAGTPEGALLAVNNRSDGEASVPALFTRNQQDTVRVRKNSLGVTNVKRMSCIRNGAVPRESAGTLRTSTTRCGWERTDLWRSVRWVRANQPERARTRLPRRRAATTLRESHSAVGGPS